MSKVFKIMCKMCVRLFGFIFWWYSEAKQEDDTACDTCKRYGNIVRDQGKCGNSEHALYQRNGWKQRPDGFPLVTKDKVYCCLPLSGTGRYPAQAGDSCPGGGIQPSAFPPAFQEGCRHHAPAILPQTPFGSAAPRPGCGHSRG